MDIKVLSKRIDGIERCVLRAGTHFCSEEPEYLIRTYKQPLRATEVLYEELQVGQSYIVEVKKREYSNNQMVISKILGQE